MTTPPLDQADAAAAAQPERPPFLAMHFESLGAQLEASKLGIWLFLGSEVLFFSGLFTAYGVYRANHRELFQYAHHFLDWRLGALNTVVLIGSSLSAAWSVRCAQLGQRRGLVATLLVTLALASVFMTVKYFEYSHKLHNGVGWGASCRPSGEILATLPAAVRALPVPARLGSFFSVYYLMTGLHGTHVLVGMGLYGWLVARARRGDFGPGYFAPVDVVALYWHLVDVIWIFLFPLFYLI
ncbi:MAG TPA: cytochrome c oxidase subunit 3 family protein [Anaeromyxobacteraceae bacterium]|nr:cytochrome c oxidase subunit 3 family protein [Anaeromyxobacteraceae bacterium]